MSENMIGHEDSPLSAVKHTILRHDYVPGTESTLNRLAIWHEETIPAGCLYFFGITEQKTSQVGDLYLAPGTRFVNQLHVYGITHLTPLTALAKAVEKETGRTIDVILKENKERLLDDG